MTLLGLLQEVFPLAKIQTNPINDASIQCDLPYEDARDFWTKDLSEELIKSIAKRFLNHIYGIPNAHVLASCEYTDTDSTSEWEEIPENILCGALKVSDILDDATVHGLSFKYENGKYYIKPNECVPN